MGLGKKDIELPPHIFEQFAKEGCAVIPDFLMSNEADELRSTCRRILDGMNPSEHVITVFSTTDIEQSRSNTKSDYFLNSGDKVRFFFEEDAVDTDGSLKVAKHLSVNKIGHALHWLVPEFKKVTFSDKVKAVARQLNFTSPAIVHSMYIFKQPGYGGEVTPHQDCTFLSTEPQSCVGLWIALEDATLDNGCLWYIPGSHHTTTARRFVRSTRNELLTFTSPPDVVDDSKFIPLPVKKGSLVLIHGSVDHKSERNLSSNSRHVYTFHIIERHNTTWDARNWLQPTTEFPFTGLYEN